MKQRTLKKSQYRPILKCLHWLIAVVVLSMLTMGFFLEEIPSAYQPMAFMLHKSFGLTVLCLMVIRLFVLLLIGRPPLPDSMPKWEKCLSHMVQYSFYVFIILMALCGWLMSTAAGRAPVYFNVFSIPFPTVSVNKPLSDWMFACHQTIAWILIGLIVLHVAGALKHYFIDRDQVLQSML